MKSDEVRFAVTTTRADETLVRLVRMQRLPLLGRPIRLLLRLMGTDIPTRTLAPGRGLRLQHGGHVVVHWATRIGNDVTLMHNVTVGRADLWQPASDDFEGVVIEDDAIVGVGAVILVSRGTLTIGRGSIVGANAVLTRSTGPGEIWAGNPARLVRRRDDDLRSQTYTELVPPRLGDAGRPSRAWRPQQDSNLRHEV